MIVLQEISAVGLGGSGLLKVLSAPSRRHLSGDDYRWEPPGDHRVHRWEGRRVRGGRAAAGRDAEGDRADRGLSAGLAQWHAPRAVRDPGKIAADLAVAVGLGGDCLADIAVVRAERQLCGPVASDPMVSRLAAYG